MAEDSGRNYVTNAVILERLDQQSNTLSKIESKVDALSETQHIANVDRADIKGRVKTLESDMNGRIKQLECESFENKEEHKTMRTRQTNFDMAAYAGNIISGILAAIGIGMK